MADPGRNQGEELSPTAREMRKAQPYLAAVWKMVGGAVVGVLGGVLVDRWLGWAPWGLVTLSVVGIGVGFYAFIREMLRLEKR